MIEGTPTITQNKKREEYRIICPPGIKLEDVCLFPKENVVSNENN